jgi:adenylate cyclase
VIPEAEFLGPVETTLRRLIIGLAAGALLAAALSAVLARSVIVTPLSRVVGETCAGSAPAAEVKL